MQWLTAILAFATTMLIFSVVVTALVETIHRAFGSRTIGLEKMLRYFYKGVISKYTEGEVKEKDSAPTSKEDDFFDKMATVRAQIWGKHFKAKELSRWSFRRLQDLPTTTFMERLGSSKLLEQLDEKSTENEEALQDIAQKYEAYTHEFALHFESRARLISVAVAMIVAWLFYVHPYNLIHTYMKNPLIAAKVELMSESALKEYEILENNSITVTNNPAEVTDDDAVATADNSHAIKPQTKDSKIDDPVTKVEKDLKDLRAKVKELSSYGVPIGWPMDGRKLSRWFVDVEEFFWIIIGGLLIGLGAPFWAQLVSNLKEVRSFTSKTADILKPPNSASQGDDKPLSTRAFQVAAHATKATNDAIAAKNKLTTGGEENTN